ncbi:hypothetical protein [Yersinia ruckeri]|uniref:hypothetical protein n=2 Tax=Yersinia ruckeri TaxID=29486 RepID=UPI0020BFA974|nr:hypothetical protein [Yersinia ruckeri]MCK8560855.1 hypothetical protein [Yersinia ruckeri]
MHKTIIYINLFIMLYAAKNALEDVKNNELSRGYKEEMPGSIEYTPIEDTPPAVSLYNIGSGTLLYSYEYEPNEYLSADYAYSLNASWNKNANWKTIYNENGTLSLKNEYSGLCLQNYFRGYQVIENHCDYALSSQQINMELVDTGAILLRFNSNSDCLYIYPSVRHYYAYSDVCKGNDFYYYWTIVPPLKK